MSEAADRVRELVELVVDALDLGAAVRVEETGEAIAATVEGEDLGLFIGRHGQTIEAVQHLAQRVVYKDQPHDGPRLRIVVDAAGYRARRQEALEGEAADAADEAIRFGRPVALDAMNATERRIVHEYLRDRDDVETHSEGEEPDRHLVVEPVKS
ncbi:MAG: single-stranded nucleic acid binding domain protein [Solirubrobacteraceae bacterium]|nr:single-stranded nucleic acid binding domain protein [Solirubrobacteraceae bacterium]